MDIKDYNFHVGDNVITTTGEIGQITGICYCQYCAERGFFEPTWRKENDAIDSYITKYDAECGFKDFYRIGEYRFNDFDRDRVLREIAYCEKELKRLKKQLKVVERLKKEVET